MKLKKVFKEITKDVVATEPKKGDREVWGIIHYEGEDFCIVVHRTHTLEEKVHAIIWREANPCPEVERREVK
jgi:hypothetical protein